MTNCWKEAKKGIKLTNSAQQLLDTKGYSQHFRSHKDLLKKQPIMKVLLLANLKRPGRMTQKDRAWALVWLDRLWRSVLKRQSIIAALEPSSFALRYFCSFDISCASILPLCAGMWCQKVCADGPSSEEENCGGGQSAHGCTWADARRTWPSS